MPMRQPRRREGQVWLAQFNTHLMEWLRSSRSTEQPIREAFIALRSLLEREPEVAETVSILCATLLHQHGRVLLPDLIEDFTRLGLEAEQMRSDDHALRWAERAVLQLALAHATNAQHRRFEALGHVRAIDLPEQAESSPGGCLRRYLGAKVDSETAALLEAGLDRGPALDHARDAVAACDWLHGAQQNLALLLRGLTELFYGDAELPEYALTAVLQAMMHDLFEIEIRNAARLTRCTIAADPAGAASAESAALIEQAVERITQRGVGDLTPVDLIACFRHASEELCRLVIDQVTAAAVATQIDPEPFAALLPAAAAAYGDCERDVLLAFLEDASGVQDLDDVSLYAVGSGLLAVAEARLGADDDPRQAAAFLQALAAVRREDGDAAHDWRIRAEFDDPISVLVSAAAAPPVEGERRIRLARLLDSLRVAPSRALVWLSQLSTGGTQPQLDDARRYADDLFGRLIFALRLWPRTVAIVVHADDDRFLFFCVTAEGLKVCEAGVEFRDAAAHATRSLADQMDLIADLQVPPDDDAVEDAGRAAFEALPDELRTLLTENDTVLVSPDYRSDTDSIPFEILRCGDEWLGISKVVTRVPSVDAMVRAAEGSPRRVPGRRLLSIAITSGDPPLPAAGQEAESVRASLGSAGWDAPPILEARVDPSFILNRMPFALHMHIAAHGEVGGAEDAVLLSHGTRLTPEAVVDGAYGCTPTVWLNTCVVGQSRYLGGGAVKGVAHAFVAAGAPAVIANLLPVDDVVSARLAERFYVHAAEHDFGESLRRARRDLADDGVSPVLWGSTVLMGDPRVTLQPHEASSLSWQQPLVHAIARRDDPDELAQLAVVLEVQAAAEPGDLRLACAADIVRGLSQAAERSRLNDASLLVEVCRLCLAIQAADGAAVAAWALSELTQDADRTLALHITNGAIGLFRPIEALDANWRAITDRLLIRAEQLRRGDRPLSVSVHNSTDAADADESRLFGELVMETKLAIDLRGAWYGLSPKHRTIERSSGDILWNAVMAARTKSFEDMPETMAYARHIARKLAGIGELPPDRVTPAATLLAGLLKWMWDGHNLAAVEKEVIEGHVCVVQLALASMNSNWSPHAPWLALVSDYPQRIEECGRALDGLPYDDKLYPAIDATMNRILDDAIDRLALVQEQYPERTPDAIAFLMGVLVEANTYSYIDGSVPEHICEKLKGVHHELSMRAEGCLMPWLMEGFRSARESGVDELQRWCYGIDASA